MKEKGMKTLISLLLVFAIPVIVIGVAAILISGLTAGGSMSTTTATIILVILMAVIVILIFICAKVLAGRLAKVAGSLGEIAEDRKSTRLNSSHL